MEWLLFFTIFFYEWRFKLFYLVICLVSIPNCFRSCLFSFFCFLFIGASICCSLSNQENKFNCSLCWNAFLLSIVNLCLLQCVSCMIRLLVCKFRNPSQRACFLNQIFSLRFDFNLTLLQFEIHDENALCFKVINCPN